MCHDPHQSQVCSQNIQESQILPDSFFPYPAADSFLNNSNWFPSALSTSILLLLYRQIAGNKNEALFSFPLCIFFNHLHDPSGFILIFL